MGPDRVALYLTLVGVCSAVVQGALIRPLSKRFSDRGLAQSGLWMMVVGFSCTAFAPNEWWMALGTFLTASGVGVSSPTLSGMVSRAAAASEQGLTFGALQAVRSITFITGPLFAGWVFDWLGAPAPYWIGAGLLAASSVAVLRDREAR
jgi:MFS family permease